MACFSPGSRRQVTWGLFKREGTGTQSSSVLPRAWEQRLQLFLGRLPRKLSGAGSLSQGSAKQPGRFVYLQTLEDSVTSFWLLLPGAAPFLGQGGDFLQIFFCCCHPGQLHQHHPLSPEVPATDPVPAATVRRVPLRWCGADGSPAFDWFCSLVAVVWWMRGLCDHGGLVAVYQKDSSSVCI